MSVKKKIYCTYDDLMSVKYCTYDDLMSVKYCTYDDLSVKDTKDNIVLYFIALLLVGHRIVHLYSHLPTRSSE